jgi:DNA processing protein
MELFELAAYIRHFNLSPHFFEQLKNCGDDELKEFIRQKKMFSETEYSKRLQCLREKLSQLNPESVLYPGHPHYPAEFSYMDDFPVFLTYEGNPTLLKSEKISVVGCRKPQETFLMWMDLELKSFLERTGATLVSGGAIGIDQKASRVAVRAGGGSIIVLPSGLVAPYPEGLKKTFPPDQILYLSEYFPGEVMHKSHFVRRNRLISALGRFLFAVQFELKSGTMITVNYGISQNKEIATIPDHPLNGLSSGNLKLIKEGAHIIGNRNDLFDLWNSTSSRQLSLTIVPMDT